MEGRFRGWRRYKKLVKSLLWAAGTADSDAVNVQQLRNVNLKVAGNTGVWIFIGQPNIGL